MTRKQIDAAREARLWIGQVIVPVATAIVTLTAIPEVRQAVAAKAKDIKESIKKKQLKRNLKVVENEEA